MHWPPRPQDLRMLHWMTESLRHTKNALLLSDQARTTAPLAELGRLATQVVHEIRNPLSTALSAPNCSG